MRLLLLALALLLPLASQAQSTPPTRESLAAVLAAFDKAEGRRVTELEAVHSATIALGASERSPGALASWWFPELRRRAEAAQHPEVKFALETQLKLDPSVPTASPIAPEPIKTVPYVPGKGDLAALVDSIRSVELGQKPALSPAQVAAFAKGPDGELATRALYLLRRMKPELAAPLLWEKLAAAKRRSDVLALEEEILRLPLSAHPKGFVAKAPEGWSRASRAAWLRVAASRPSLKVDKETVFGLLKGPADELTEAAWDSVPRVFSAADRARLTAASAGLSERLAPRAKQALEALR
jgi:hypothetical protein